MRDEWLVASSLIFAALLTATNLFNLFLLWSNFLLWAWSSLIWSRGCAITYLGMICHFNNIMMCLFQDFNSFEKLRLWASNRISLRNQALFRSMTLGDSVAGWWWWWSTTTAPIQYGKMSYNYFRYFTVNKNWKWKIWESRILN